MRLTWAKDHDGSCNFTWRSLQLVFGLPCLYRMSNKWPCHRVSTPRSFLSSDFALTQGEWAWSGNPEFVYQFSNLFMKPSITCLNKILSNLTVSVPLSISLQKDLQMFSLEVLNAFLYSYSCSKRTAQWPSIRFMYLVGTRYFSLKEERSSGIWNMFGE